MFLIRLWNFIKGYVIIEVSGYFTERFINICTRRQILLWDICWYGAERLRMKMSIKAFCSIRPVCKKSHCSVRLLEKKGLPFIVFRYRGRTGLVIGLLLFILILYLLTSIIWSIEITGNKTIRSDEITLQLNEMGIFKGKFKYGIKTSKIVQNLMKKNSLISWVGVELKGIKLKIKIVEGIKPPPLVPINQPCDIVAKTDGVVYKIYVKEGMQKVKENETVRKGQVLISGNVKSIHPEFESRKVHAIGEVFARTWHEVSRYVKRKIIVRERTGRYQDKKWIFFLDLKVPLPGNDVKYDIAEKIVFDKTIGKEGKYKLPLGIRVERNFEIVEKEVFLDITKARKLALDSALKAAYKQLAPGAEVIEESYEFKEDRKGGEFAVVTLECIENIGIMREMGGS